MKEAHDHHRISPEGKIIGKKMASLADAEWAELEKDGEHDDRCKTCAFRHGTVPNGCLQTQADAVKAVTEDVPFLCHQKEYAICGGWFAVRRIINRKEQSTGKKLPPCSWDFSLSDEQS